MNRRKFLGVAGTTAVLGRNVAGLEIRRLLRLRTRIDLNGAWKKVISGTTVRTLTVPSSQRPSGSYELIREFALPQFNRTSVWSCISTLLPTSGVSQ